MVTISAAPVPAPTAMSIDKVTGQKLGEFLVVEWVGAALIGHPDPFVGDRHVRRVDLAGARARPGCGPSWDRLRRRKI